MPNVITRVLLFLSSYFPLALIFFLLLVEKHRELAISILLIGILGLSGMTLYLRAVSRLAPMAIHVAGVQRRDGDAMSYIVSYLIPFLAIPFSRWQEAAALTMFIVVLGILYVNSNMIHINPMLNLFGYHLYEITLPDGGIHSLIARHRVVRNATLHVITVGEGILLEKSK